MKLATDKQTKLVVMIVMILTSFVDSRVQKSLKKKWIWESVNNINEHLKDIEGEASDKDLLIKFVQGILNTIGIKGAGNIAAILDPLATQISEETYTFTEDQVKYTCNFDGFKKYIAQYGELSMNEAEQLKFKTCSDEQKRIDSAIQEIHKSMDCIAMKLTDKTCTEEMLVSYKNLVSKRNLNENDLKSSYNEFKKLFESLDEEYTTFKELNCKESGYDMIIKPILLKLKQGFFAAKFYLSCQKDLGMNVAEMVFTAILSFLASFMTGGFYTFARLLIIVIKMNIAVVKLILQYSWKTQRFYYIGQVIGYLIRLGLELAHFPNLDSPFMKDNRSMTGRRLKLKK